MPDDETAGLERLIRIVERAPKHLRRAATHEILKHLSEQGDAKAEAALSVLISPERIQLYRDLKDALTWDNWIMSETGKFRPTDKSQYHDPDELIEAYLDELPPLVEKYVDELVERGELKSYETDGETYYHRVGAGDESDEAGGMNGPSIVELYEAGKLNARAYRALKGDGVILLAELCHWSESDLLRAPNVGRITVAHVQQVMADHGITLRQ